MEGDFLDEPWAKAAVEKFERSIAEQNRIVDDPNDKIRIAWGFPDAQFATVMAGAGKTNAMEPAQFGLLSWRDLDVNMNIDAPHEGFTLASLHLDLKPAHPFLTTPDNVFGASWIPHTCCTLRFTHTADSSSRPHEVEIWCVDTFIIVDIVTGPVLEFTLKCLRDTRDDLRAHNFGVDPRA